MDVIAYPVLFEKVEDMYLVTVPDIGQMTQGNDLTDAIAMARDLISLWVTVSYTHLTLPTTVPV